MHGRDAATLSKMRVNGLIAVGGTHRKGHCNDRCGTKTRERETRRWHYPKEARSRPGQGEERNRAEEGEEADGDDDVAHAAPRIYLRSVARIRGLNGSMWMSSAGWR